MLEQHTPWRAVPLGVRTESMGWHGNALLIRREHELIGHDLIRLPAWSRAARSRRPCGPAASPCASWACISIFRACGGRRQASALVHYLDQPNLPPVDATILMGDLNEWSAVGGCIQDFTRSFQLASCGRSYHATRPIAALDRILWRGALSLADGGVQPVPCLPARIRSSADLGAGLHQTTELPKTLRSS